jgi:hypothetical protein
LKHLHNFIIWQWQRCELWQKIYVISLTFIAIGVFWSSILGTIMLLLGVVLLLAWMFKWAVWDSLSYSYKEFIKERNEQD